MHTQRAWLIEMRSSWKTIMDFMEVVRRSRVEGVSLQAAREGDIIVGGTLVVTAYILHQEDSWGR